MCGRCVIFTHDEVLGIIGSIASHTSVCSEPDWPARMTQAYPKSLVPLIVPSFDTALPQPSLTQETLSVQELSWGFEESWKPGLVFNTRIESSAKPTWRESMEHRRCIIPVSAFFETHRAETYPSPQTGKAIKRPYEFRQPNYNVMFIGGTWRGGCFSMVTTEANADMAPIHHRMPLVLTQEELPLWFGSSYQQLADRSALRLVAEPASETLLQTESQKQRVLEEGAQLRLPLF